MAKIIQTLDKNPLREIKKQTNGKAKRQKSNKAISSIENAIKVSPKNVKSSSDEVKIKETSPLHKPTSPDKKSDSTSPQKNALALKENASKTAQNNSLKNSIVIFRYRNSIIFEIGANMRLEELTQQKLRETLQSKGLTEEQIVKILQCCRCGKTDHTTCFCPDNPNPYHRSCSGEPPTKKKKTNSRQEAIEAEKSLRDLENRRLDPNYKPETALEFEELLQRNPKSYESWIMYGCFHLANGELKKATTVLKRALDTLPLEEGRGRRKVWQILLRLELTFGSKESAADLFNEALACNDPVKMYPIISDIYFAAGYLEEAKKTINKMIKKFSKWTNVWMDAATFFYERNSILQGAEILKRSFVTLPKKEHVNIASKSAQLEFKYGCIEKGKTTFEAALSENPKRLDIWYTYTDLLKKSGDIEGTRHIFERMTGLILKPKKMRSIFMKFQNFEKEHGTPQSLESVTKRVADYIASQKGDNKDIN